MGDADGFFDAGAVDFFFLFGEAYDGEVVEAEFVELGDGDSKLAFASVDDDEVGKGDPLGIFGDDFGFDFGMLGFESAQGVERIFLGEFGGFGTELVAGFEEDAGVATLDDFGHGEEVVLAVDDADAVATVFGVVGDAVFEADHAGDTVGGADVGDVETFHDQRGTFESEVFLKLFDIGHGVDGGGESEVGGALEGAHGFEGFLQVLEHVAQFGGAFEVEFGGGFFHLLLNGVEEAFGFAVEEVASLADADAVFVGSDSSDAGGGAVFDDVVVTVLVVVGVGIGGSADAQAELAIHPVEGGAQGTAMGKGPEVAGVVVFFESGEAETREGVGGLDFDEEVAFVVLEADVVFGSEVLDEAHLEDEGFAFVANGVEFEVPDGFDERAGLGVGMTGAGGGEVVAEALAKIAGFADVDHLAKAVAHDVDAWLMRHVVEAGVEVGLFAT